ncbi:unnamed protein product [Phyllotreta striolata]|uniref:Methyltransferase domain-containing protein n=1 Tax=Phyllotreta striolata TaxID=444603 RepID=A0A9N9TL69_PHYSR|nr:unnamed protein product [Phyllotreta striolata]
MSLPRKYTNATDYLRDVLNLLSKYRWIYNYQNTHILVRNTFDRFPGDWVDFFSTLSNEELNRLPINGLKNCPDSLAQLLDDIKSLTPCAIYEEVLEDNCEFSHNNGLSAKKRHEIISLAPIINRICTDYKVELIIDVGSGLGYLSHYLNSKYDYKVMGLERSKGFVELALRNQEKFYPKSKNCVIFKELFIDSESSKSITDLVGDNFESTGIKSSALVGLHACADLSVNILDVFSTLQFAKVLIIMPCCYHRMNLQSSNGVNGEEYFVNFPISNTLKELYKEFNAQEYLRTPFLRLSCQQTIGNFINMTEAQHERHAQDLMFRCILQAVAETEHYQVKRLKRKQVNINGENSDENFEGYLRNVRIGHCLLDCRNETVDIDDSFLDKMRLKWKDYKSKCFLMEALTSLQAAMQRMCENVVLIDRIEYMREKGFECMAMKITNDQLSPRSFAIVATKG